MRTYKVRAMKSGSVLAVAIATGVSSFGILMGQASASVQNSGQLGVSSPTVTADYDGRVIQVASVTKAPPPPGPYQRSMTSAASSAVLGAAPVMPAAPEGVVKPAMPSISLDAPTAPAKTATDESVNAPTQPQAENAAVEVPKAPAEVKAEVEAAPEAPKMDAASAKVTAPEAPSAEAPKAEIMQGEFPKAPEMDSAEAPKVPAVTMEKPTQPAAEKVELVSPTQPAAEKVELSSPEAPALKAEEMATPVKPVTVTSEVGQAEAPSAEMVSPTKPEQSNAAEPQAPAKPEGVATMQAPPAPTFNVKGNQPQQLGKDGSGQKSQYGSNFNMPSFNTGSMMPGFMNNGRGMNFGNNTQSMGMRMPSMGNSMNMPSMNAPSMGNSMRMPPMGYGYRPVMPPVYYVPVPVYPYQGGYYPYYGKPPMGQQAPAVPAPDKK